MFPFDKYCYHELFIFKHYVDDFVLLGDGSRVNVYVVDTGVNPTHRDFSGRSTAWYDALGGDVSINF